MRRLQLPRQAVLLAVLLLPSPSIAASPPPAGEHLELFTWYDFNTTQHGWAWATFYPEQLPQWYKAWKDWRMPGMWNLEYLQFDGARFWDRNCSMETHWACGLRPGWQAALAAALVPLQPYIDEGSLKGMFLGDEPMLVGISAANITAVADFIRARVGSKPRIYWNDGCRPFYDGKTEPCVEDPGHNPASCWTNTSKVPASVDWVSCDAYQDPTKSKGAWPWDPSSTVPEANAQRYFYDHFIKPKLHESQRVVLVPGLFGNRSDAWTDQYLTAKLNGYWQWAQEDPLVAGFNPYHFNDRTQYAGCTGESPGVCEHKSAGSGLTPCCYKFGAASYPGLLGAAEQIGRAVLNRTQRGR